jgi:hypothetical protein
MYRVGVWVKGESEAVYNGLRFATVIEAQAYAMALPGRWTAVDNAWVEEVSDASQ